MKAYAQATGLTQCDRDLLIAEHLEAARRISLQIARRCPSWISVDDLLAAGRLGLTEAAQRFDPTRGQPFLAFASRWIRGATIDELRRGDFMPRRLRAKAKAVGRAIRELEHKLGRDPEDEEIAAKLGVPVEEFRTELSTLVHANVFSLDETTPQAAAKNGPQAANPEREMMRAQMREQLLTGLRRLPARDALILSLYYNEECTYAELGELLGVTKSRVCQLHARALTRLRAEIEAME